MTATLAYTRFELLRSARNRRYIVFTFVMPVFFYLAFSTAGGPDSNIGGVQFTAYFLVSMVAYAAINSAFSAGGARLAGERVNGWARQLRISPLSSTSYVFAKVTTAVLLAVPGSLLVGLAGVIAHDVRLPAIRWVQLYLTVWIAVLPFAALAMVIGHVFDVDSAQFATFFCLFVLSLVGGLWAPMESFPGALQAVGKVLPTWEIGNVARAALGGGLPSAVDLLGLLLWTVLFGGLLAVLYRREEARLR